MKFRLFPGTENARNSVPSHSAEEKKSSEVRSKPFHKREKHSELRNFDPNHFAEDKNALNSVPNHFTEEENILI
jgi:hypothetical protein